MILKKIRYLTAALLISGCAMVFAAPGLASADANTSLSHQDACAGLTQLDSSSDCSTNGDSRVSSLVGVIINILSLIVGIISVIMIIVAGMKYITSGGDSNNITSAKNTLIYALIGIVIVVLAQVMVHFVVNRTLSATTPPAQTTQKAK